MRDETLTADHPAKAPLAAKDAGSDRMGRATALLCLMLVAAVWLTTRPYTGIVHDAQLYLVQAMNRLDPARFGSDIYFRYGSQDRFSLFSALYAPLVEAIGPPRAQLVTAVLGQASWLAALGFLVRCILQPGRLRMLAIFCVCLLVPVYNFGTLRYGEAFATPRIFVEALTLVAVGFVCSGRRVAAFCVMAGAITLHPLMALPGIGVVLLLSFPFRRFLLPSGLAGAGLFLALGWGGVDPFVRVFARMDADWAAIVLLRNPMVFVGTWFPMALPTVVLPLLSLGLVALRGTGELRRLARVTLALVAALVAASWVGGDLAANLLFLDLQLWRGMWLWMVLGNCLAPAAFGLLPVQGTSRHLFLAALAANVFEARFGVLTLPVVSACLGLAVLTGVMSEGAGLRSRRVLGLAGSGFAALATLAFAAEGVALALQLSRSETALSFVGGTGVLVGASLLVAGIARGRTAATPPVLAGGIALVILAAALWDQRNPEMGFITREEAMDTDFREALRGQTVYWENGLGLQWFSLREPSYFSWYQAAGAVFFRETAFEHRRRADVLRRLDTSDFAVDENRFGTTRADPRFEGPQSGAQLRAVCLALPELDALVLRADLADVPHLRWKPPFKVPASGYRIAPEDQDPDTSGQRPGGVFNLYSCDLWR